MLLLGLAVHSFLILCRDSDVAVCGQVRVHPGQEGGGGGAAQHGRLDTRHQG
jgi:hypothetical protein